jgi:uncharacterized protein (TIGR04141 family)
MKTIAKEKVRKERLAIYLAKEVALDDFSLIKTENAEPPITLEIGSGTARLYIKKEPPKPPPPWTKLFTGLPNVPDDAFGSSNSVGAVLVYQAERTFIVSFGHGFHLVKDDYIERDFGLRVTLNSVEPEKLRSLDKASYDINPLNSRTQSSKDLDIFDLEMDSEMEMLYAVTGASNEPIFGTHVTGRDALTIVVQTTVAGLPTILATALAKYKLNLPQAFEWVDNINRVRDAEEIELLDLYLNDLLDTDPSSSVWLGEPEIVDWETQVGYSFDMRPKTPRHTVLELSDLQAYLAAGKASMTVDVLKSQAVHINNADFQSTKSWTAYRCLYAEMHVGEGHFILRNATWYRVKDTFVDVIDKYLLSLPNCGFAFPTYAHSREEDYNEHVSSQDPSFVLMDKKNTPIGGPYDKIEFCDLIKDNTTLIHVKYYRSSSTLSHLFAQGNVAAEAFIRDEDFRARLNEKLPAGAKLVDTKIRPDASTYKVIFAIATKKNLPLELPFFSKVTLKNALRTLRALNFEVEIASIPIDPTLLKTTKFKPK